MDEYYAGAYWLGRRETAEDCARRAELFFHLLAKCAPVFTSWFETGWTPEEALEQRLEPTAASILRDFLQQEQTKEEGYPGEGFRLGLWNGEFNDAMSGLSLLCGDASVRVCNCCVLNLPKRGIPAERVLQVPVLTQILRAMVLAWEPEFAIATSHEHRKQVSDSAEVGTFVGWLTYFSHRRGTLPPLPAPVRVEPVEDRGSLVILTPERLSSADPAYLPLARDVASRLSAAGLMGPLRPWNS